MLQNQHLVVFGSVLPESPRHVGCIDPACDVESVVCDAYENARFLCERYYLTSPSMNLACHNAVHPGKPITVVSVPSHLYHIMFELFKNAMRATIEFHGVDEELPAVGVNVVCGQEDLSIKISDRGAESLERYSNVFSTTCTVPLPLHLVTAPKRLWLVTATDFRFLVSTLATSLATFSSSPWKVTVLTPASI
ncbi:hypothetical protein L596_030503 [Steinernema carpocapsae]|uniref:Protein-serine/threonine kinase n=1 Tax=Steinernema carpocapsae TaxID=34508 RepID=A0A4U5LPL6_STECR|nr:hypothetical protein L596_030503 [Steinernema carpocapsae]